MQKTKEYQVKMEEIKKLQKDAIMWFYRYQNPQKSQKASIISNYR